jgi:hypothetical protein
VTVVLAEVKLPSDLVSGVFGGDVKSDRSGVIEQEAPVSMTIGSSPGIVEVKIDGETNGRVSLYLPSVAWSPRASSRIRLCEDDVEGSRL